LIVDEVEEVEEVEKEEIRKVVGLKMFIFLRLEFGAVSRVFATNKIYD
jgi:hypothetical protein